MYTQIQTENYQETRQHFNIEIVEIECVMLETLENSAKDDNVINVKSLEIAEKTRAL
jgi:hypothetical protein